MHLHDADYLGQIKFAGESDTGVERNYAKITGKIKDVSNGTEDGIIEIAILKMVHKTSVEDGIVKLYNLLTEQTFQLLEH